MDKRPATKYIVPLGKRVMIVSSLPLGYQKPEGLVLGKEAIVAYADHSEKDSDYGDVKERFRVFKLVSEKNFIYVKYGEHGEHIKVRLRYIENYQQFEV